MNRAKVVFRFPKPNFISHEAVASVAWGEASIQANQNNILVCVIAWGKFIYLVKVCLFDNELGFHKTSYAMFNQEIAYASIIAPSIIMAIPK